MFLINKVYAKVTVGLKGLISQSAYVIIQEEMYSMTTLHFASMHL